MTDLNTTAKLPPTARKPRRNEAKSVRRLQLIEATIDCIAKYGISGTTLAKVTERAGVSVGLVNFQFKSKKKLLEETLRFVATEHRDQWRNDASRADLNDAERLMVIINSLFHPRICSRKRLAVWFAFFGEATNRSVYRSIVAEIDDERHLESTRLIGNLTADEQSSGIDPASISLMIEALTDGLWLNMLVYPSDFPIEFAKAKVVSLLAMHLPKHFSSETPRDSERP